MKSKLILILFFFLAGCIIITGAIIVGFLTSPARTYVAPRNTPITGSQNTNNEEAPLNQQKKLTAEILPDPHNTLSLLAVGDIMLSRHVNTKMKETQDWTLPMKKTQALLTAADITFGNLESPFYDSGAPVRAGMVFKAEPFSVASLVSGGFDILNLANNHMLNQGVNGLVYTLDWLNQHGIATTGAGKNFAETHQGTILTVKGVRFGFLGYSYDGGYNDTPMAQKPVVADMRIEQLQDDVARLNSEVDILIVTMHAGAEYKYTANPQQIDFAHTAIDAGADLVIGHHPHVPQPVENYHDKWIFYSLGNFIFDQAWSQETTEGLIAKIVFNEKKIFAIELIPVIIENYSTPRIATKEESKTILNRIGRNSATLFPSSE